MALFRYHRGMLEDSLKTTVVVKNTKELGELLLNHHKEIYGQTKEPMIRFRIEAYPNKEHCFDKRIGWYTHIVTRELEGGGVYGYLSEDIE